MPMASLNGLNQGKKTKYQDTLKVTDSRLCRDTTPMKLDGSTPGYKDEN